MCPKVKKGHLIRVENKDRLKEFKRYGEAKVYFAVKLELKELKKEFWCLLTPTEVISMPLCQNLCDGYRKRKTGRIYSWHEVNGTSKGFVDIVLPPPPESRFMVDRNRFVMICQKTITRGMERAKKHPEYIPEQSWLSDLLD